MGDVSYSASPSGSWGGEPGKQVLFLPLALESKAEEQRLLAPGSPFSQQQQNFKGKPPWYLTSIPPVSFSPAR